METQAASRKPWTDVPGANKQTMRAAVKALIDWLDDNWPVGEAPPPGRIRCTALLGAIPPE